MNIARCEAFLYEIPLLRSLSMMCRVLTMRSGLIILIRDEEGNAGVGEVAPFPGLHKENLSAAKDSLLGIIEQITGSEVPGNLRDLEVFLNHWFENQGPPSVRFGIEQAFLLLFSCKQKVPLYRLLFRTYNDIVRVNALLTGSVDEIIKEAKQCIREGYRTLKLKVGHRSIDEDIKIVELLRKAISNEIGLRLDANKSWSLKEAISFGKAVVKYNIEYIEEPVKNPDELCGFYYQTGLPVALDESLISLAEAGSEWPEGTRAVILKPSLLGGIFRTMTLAGLAKESKITPVISCAFLSGLSLALLTQLSAGLGYPETAMGLDTYKWFKYDILQRPFCVKQGQVNAREADQIMRNLRFELLARLC